MSVESAAVERKKFYANRTLMDRLVERGRAFVRLYKKCKEIGCDKKEIGDELKQSMLDAGLTEVKCGKATVVLSSGKTKEVTKGDLIQILGGDEGERVWGQIKSKTYQYLTVALPLLMIVPVALFR